MYFCIVFLHFLIVYSLEIFKLLISQRNLQKNIVHIVKMKKKLAKNTYNITELEETLEIFFGKTMRIKSE